MMSIPHINTITKTRIMIITLSEMLIRILKINLISSTMYYFILYIKFGLSIVS